MGVDPVEIPQLADPEPKFLGARDQLRTEKPPGSPLLRIFPPEELLELELSELVVAGVVLSELPSLLLPFLAAGLVDFQQGAVWSRINVPQYRQISLEE